jgi:hypothetical protein
MNCKPGDLAVIVNPRHPELMDLVGRILRVKRVIDHDCFGDPCWSYEGRRIKHPIAGTLRGASDAWLRPIRDPGDDATDETLLWLPSPTGEKESA